VPKVVRFHLVLDEKTLSKELSFFSETHLLQVRNNLNLNPHNKIREPKLKPLDFPKENIERVKGISVILSVI